MRCANYCAVEKRSSDARSHFSTGIGGANGGGPGRVFDGRCADVNAGAETPALRSISSRLDGALSTVLIEASEPVAYLTSQPDPLTVLVDLRNVAAGSIASQQVSDVLEPVGSVKVEAAYAPDGAPVARVRVNLERAAKHRVRSARNTILVEVDRGHGSAGRDDQRCSDARAAAARRRAERGRRNRSAHYGAGDRESASPGRPGYSRCASVRSRTATRSRSPATARWWQRRSTRPATGRIGCSSISRGVASGSAPAVTPVEQRPTSSASAWRPTAASR